VLKNILNRMLIDGHEVKNMLNQFNICVKGVLHVGAHECEELPFYTNNLNVPKENIVWVEALEGKVNEAKGKGVQNIFHGVISNEDDKEVIFHVSNNIQSSSILEFGTHAHHHSWVKYEIDIIQKTKTLSTFFQEKNLDSKNYNLWNFDIQGAELMALEGAKEHLQNVDALYLEVNTEEVYKGCGLIGQIDDYVKGFGFERKITKMTEHGWGDALYIKVA
jgi:FkbM family methyltransferase